MESLFSLANTHAHTHARTHTGANRFIRVRLSSKHATSKRTKKDANQIDASLAAAQGFPKVYAQPTCKVFYRQRDGGA
jgi:hypothetical protein